MNKIKFDSIIKGGAFLTVKFRKKDGTIRTMNCRTKVHKYIKGTGKPITDGRIVAFEPQAGKGADAYRSFWPESIIELHANGHHYDSEGTQVA